VLPFDPDPRLLGAFFALVVTAAAVAMGVALRRLVAMYMPEDDPRRQLVAQVLLYAGTFIVIAASVWLRRR
jgi:heme/copper-type cytochrome/quinol oxidase subunit 4